MLGSLKLLNDIPEIEASSDDPDLMLIRSADIVVIFRCNANSGFFYVTPLLFPYPLQVKAASSASMLDRLSPLQLSADDGRLQ